MPRRPGVDIRNRCPFERVSPNHALVPALAHSPSALARIDSVGRNILFYFFLAGIIIPFQAIMIPLYYQLRDLGLLTTYLAGILP